MSRQIASMEATRRSILRYLNRYEREWGTVGIAVYGWEMVGCTPPEEDADMNVILSPGRTRVALGALVRDGLLERQRQRDGRRAYRLTDAGRET